MVPLFKPSETYTIPLSLPQLANQIAQTVSCLVTTGHHTYCFNIVFHFHHDFESQVK